MAFKQPAPPASAPDSPDKLFLDLPRDFEEFRVWATRALSTVRDLRPTFVESGDIDWRIEAAEAFEAHGLDAPSLYERLQARRAASQLEAVDA